MKLEKGSWRRCQAFMAAVGAALLLIGLAAAPALSDEHKQGDVSEEISEAFDAIKAYGFEQKEEFLAWAENRSAALRDEVKALDKKLAKADEKGRKQLKEARKALLKQEEKLEKAIDEVRESSAEAWEDAKWGFSAAMEKLERAYDRAVSRFEDDK